MGQCRREESEKNYIYCNSRFECEGRRRQDSITDGTYGVQYLCVCVHHISQQTKSENRVTEREWSVKMQETDSSIAPLNLALLH